MTSGSRSSSTQLPTFTCPRRTLPGAEPFGRSGWLVDEHGPRSQNDPAGENIDGISHSRKPWDYVPLTGPDILLTTHPVPRVMRHGLLVVPDTIDAREPWSRLDLIVDVLRKRADLLTPGPTPRWEMRKGDGQGTWDTWIHVLGAPLDISWLHAHALLPLDLRFFDSWFGDHDAPWLSDGNYVIR